VSILFGGIYYDHFADVIYSQSKLDAKPDVSVATVMTDVFQKNDIMTAP
jgi:hypothetical protein